VQQYKHTIEWCLISIFLLSGFVLNVWHIPLFDVDEGAFSEATREILASGIWAATYLDGVPRFDKPILTYWLQASFVLSFGLNEFALRLHSIIAAILWGAALYLFCKQFINRQTAFAAILIFSSVLMVTMIGRAATADAVLNLFICLSFFDIYRFQQSSNKKHLYRAWLWMSLGMLTKGPVAMVIPLFSSGIWLWSLQQKQQWFRIAFNIKGALIMALVLCPWLYLVWQEQGADFFYGFLVEHNLQRFTATKENHGGQWYYYLIVLPLVLLPYTGLLGLFTKFKKLWQKPFERLLIIWFLVVFVLVSLSKTQLPHYVLYGVTPLLILFAKYRRAFNGKYLIWLIAPLLFFINIAIVIYTSQTTQWSENNYVNDMLSTMPTQFDKGYLAACLCFLLALIISSYVRTAIWKKLVFTGLLQSLFVYNWFVPAYAEIQQAPVKAAAEFARSIEQPIVAYKIHMPSFSVYRQAITHRRDVKAGDVVFTKSDKAIELATQFGSQNIQQLFNQQGIVLLQINNEEQQ